MKQNIASYSCMVLFLLLTAGCKKIIEIDPPKNQITPASVFANDASVNAAIANIYSDINTIDDNFNIQAGVYTDELVYTGADAGLAECNSSILSINNTNVQNIWKVNYYLIYQANLLIEGLSGSMAGVTDSIKMRAISEAKFLRAYCYFNLINIFHEVPLILTTDVRYTATAPRDAVSKIYQQIIEDLKVAESTLGISYPDNDKSRVNKYVATALLSKAYLYTSDWAKAIEKVTSIIESGVYNLTIPGDTFIQNSGETLWQIWNQYGFTGDGIKYLSNADRPVYILTDQLVAAFEPQDQRLNYWTNEVVTGGISYRFPYKYKNTMITTGALAEYTVKFRLAEQYLIRATARIMKDDIIGALEDVNKVRSRSGLPDIKMPISRDSCITVVERESRIELFTENGNRFFELKRNNTIDSILSLQKTTWRNTAKYFPVPQNERITNTALSQNPGY